MALEPIGVCVNMVRNELGDLEGVNFKSSEIKSMLYNAVRAVNSLLDTSYSLGENEGGTFFVSAPADLNHMYLIALECAINLLEAEHTSEVLGGEAGISFKSGPSSFSNTGRDISYRGLISGKRELFNRMVLGIKTGSANDSAAEIDLFGTTDSNTLGIE